MPARRLFSSTMCVPSPTPRPAPLPQVFPTSDLSPPASTAHCLTRSFPHSLIPSLAYPAIPLQKLVAAAYPAVMPSATAASTTSSSATAAAGVKRTSSSRVVPVEAPKEWVLTADPKTSAGFKCFLACSVAGLKACS